MSSYATLRGPSASRGGAVARQHSSVLGGVFEGGRQQSGPLQGGTGAVYVIGAVDTGEPSAADGASEGKLNVLGPA